MLCFRKTSDELQRAHRGVMVLMKKVLLLGTSDVQLVNHSSLPEQGKGSIYQRMYMCSAYVVCMYQPDLAVRHFQDGWSLSAAAEARTSIHHSDAEAGASCRLPWRWGRKGAKTSNEGPIPGECSVFLLGRQEQFIQRHPTPHVSLKVLSLGLFGEKGGGGGSSFLGMFKDQRWGFPRFFQSVVVPIGCPVRSLEELRKVPASLKNRRPIFGTPRSHFKVWIWGRGRGGMVQHLEPSNHQAHVPMISSLQG